MIEGKATLSLIDEKGETIKKVVHKNMLTNALNNLFNPPMESLLNIAKNSNFSYSSFFDDRLPIYKNFCSGLILFNNTLPENKNNMELNKDSIIVGLGGTLTDTTGYPMMGTLNASETGLLEEKDPDSGKKGYRFVWDFGTDKLTSEGGNAIINSVALTSSNMGSAMIQEGNVSCNKLILPTFVYTNVVGTGTTDTNAKNSLYDGNNYISYPDEIINNNLLVSNLGCFDTINYLIVDWGFSNIPTNNSNTELFSKKIIFKKIILFPYDNIKLTTEKKAVISESKEVDISSYGSINYKQISFDIDDAVTDASSDVPPQYTIDEDNNKMYLFINHTSSNVLSAWKVIRIDLINLSIDWVTELGSNVPYAEGSYIGYYDKKIIYKAFSDSDLSYIGINPSSGSLQTSTTGSFAASPFLKNIIGRAISTSVRNNTLIIDVYSLNLEYHLLFNDKNVATFYKRYNQRMRRIASKNINYPYILLDNLFTTTVSGLSPSTIKSNGGWKFQLDCAYLATINNLNSAIEKTPSLALKVQYDLIEV